MGRLSGERLSSQPLCFNLFGVFKLDMERANLFFCKLISDYLHHVDGIYFEHSPGRGDRMFTQDNSAFDVFVTCIAPTGESAFIAIEVKYSETMTELPAKLRPRYDELSAVLRMFRDSAAPIMREAPLQQLWREHMLSRAMVKNDGYSQGRFVVIHPAQNATVNFPQERINVSWFRQTQPRLVFNRSLWRSVCLSFPLLRK